MTEVGGRTGVKIASFRDRTSSDSLKIHAQHTARWTRAYAKFINILETTPHEDLREQVRLVRHRLCEDPYDKGLYVPKCDSAKCKRDVKCRIRAHRDHSWTRISRPQNLLASRWSL